MSVAGHKLVFIGGLHRSGTSVLFRCLREHPAISGFQDTGVPEDEGQLLQSVYPPAWQHGGPGRFGFRPEAHLTEQSPLATSENAETLFSQWSQYWDLSRRVLLEKSPPNLIRTRFLNALFPSAKFLAIIRHPLAVAYSTRRWRPRMSLDVLLAHWLRCHTLFANDIRWLPAGVCTLRYEEFVAQPDEIIQKVLAFLHLEPAAIAEPIRADRNERYLALWMSEPLAVRRQLLEKYGPAAERFGYSLAEPKRTYFSSPAREIYVTATDRPTPARVTFDTCERGASGTQLSTAAPDERGGTSPRVLIGMGTGRCGTRSLAVLLSRQPSTAVTHEMRPLLTWEKRNVGQGIIRARFELLANRFPKVARVGDVASSYLPYVEDILAALDDVRIVCLRRERQETIDSFIRWITVTRGGRAVNHWSADRDGFEADRWDAFFPKYPTRDMADAVGRYWDDYYAQAERLVDRFPQRVRIFPAEDVLDDSSGMADLLDWVGIPREGRSMRAVHVHRGPAQATP